MDCGCGCGASIEGRRKGTRFATAICRRRAFERRAVGLPESGVPEFPWHRIGREERSRTLSRPYLSRRRR